MFCTAERDSPLRLIDFGSGTLDGMDGFGPSGSSSSSSDDVDRHHTFAGSAFYISPEMFQHDYNTKTDVWSAGTTLYVMAAGYPADALQDTFDVLQGSRPGRLRNLPNLPKNMPDSFYDMLEGALVYRHRNRKDAGQLMECEFSQFHILHHGDGGGGGGGGTISITEIVAEAGAGGGGGGGESSTNDGSSSDIMTTGENRRSMNKRTTSVVLEGSVNRHNAYLGYQKFERSVTTILATMLAKDTSRRFLSLLREQHDATTTACGTESTTPDRANNKKKLQVVTIKVLLELLDGIPVNNDGAATEVWVFRFVHFLLSC
jgi:serine/threonine protein kinase